MFSGFMAQSKTIFVSEKATGTKNGTTWANAYVGLQSALSAAKSGDEIWVAEGVYIPGNTSSSIFELKSGVSLYGGFFGDEKSKNERDWRQYKTVLSGEIGDANLLTDNIEQILKADEANGTVHVDGFTVSKGYSTGFMAGGLLIEACSPVFQNCIFENNHAQGGFSSGGAVTITGFDGVASPEFINCIFKDNTCSVIGGAVHINNVGNKPVFKGCLFENNTAVRGAALHNGGGDITTYNCTFVKNTADKGAASYTSSGNTTTHINAIIWSNDSKQSIDIANSSSSATTKASYSIVQGGFSGTGNIASDPQFSSSIGYELSTNSPARNSADQTVVSLLAKEDLNGTSRVTYKKLDRGAYESICDPKNATSASITENSCGPFTAPSGRVLTTSGTYQDVIPNYNGCDSVITIELSINNNDTSFTVTSCISYQLNDKTYDKTGVYTQVLTNSKGCDSTINLDLTINQVNTEVNQNGGTLASEANAATYQWINCTDNSPVDGANAQQFTPTEDGDYAVVVTKNGCTDTSDCITMTPSGLPFVSAGALKMYPNPAHSQLYIEFQYTEPQEVIFRDMSGREWNLGYIDNGTLLPIGFLQPGMYIVRVGQLHPQQLVKLR